MQSEKSIDSIKLQSGDISMDPLETHYCVEDDS